jgi:hypothetical protein
MRLPPQAALYVVLAIGALPLGAQTLPLRTEEAETAPAGRLVLETAAEWIHAEPNFLTGQPRDRWDVPSLNLVYSPAGNVELDLAWVGRVIAVSDPDFGTVSDWGDVTLRAKWRFVEGRGRRPALAARFGVTLAETSFGNGLGPNTLRTSAQLLATETLGRLKVHANAGLALFDEALRPHEQRDFLQYGLALELRLGTRLSAVGELAGLRGKGMPGADEHSELRLGGRYEVGRVRLAAALRYGLLPADGELGVSAGVSFRIRR